MKTFLNICAGALLLTSLFALILSFGAMRDNHRNYDDIIKSYEKLVSIYESQIDSEPFSIAVADRIEYLKSDIVLQRESERSSSLKPSLNNMYFIFFLGLFGLAVFEITKGYRASANIKV